MTTPVPVPTTRPNTSATTTPVRRLGDRVFSGLSTGAGVLILVILAGVAAFLIFEALPVFGASPEELPGEKSFLSYVGPLVFGTIWASVIALLVAAPLAIGIALFIAYYAPKRVAAGLGYMVDLLAAVPSIVYGIWGIQWLSAQITPAYGWLGENLSFIPLFAGPASSTGRTILTAGLVLAVMILPIMSAICREVFLQVPTLHREAAMALGATRFEMIRLAVLPFGRSGVISGAMLALGRALGETMAVAVVLSVSGAVTFNLISSDNPATIAANIALQFPESSGIGVNALIATGLVLFVITLAVNMGARWIISRRKDFSGAN